MKRIAYLGWGVAALLLVYAALAFKAPVIEDDVDARAKAAVQAVATHPIAVETDGRGVSLVGVADDEAERDAIITAAEEVWGALGPQDQLTVLPRLDPYPFTLRVEDGVVSATGAAPTAAEAAALTARLREAFGPETQVALEIGAGAPDPAWTAALSPILDAASMLDSAVVDVSGDRVQLSGASRSEATLADVAAQAEAAMGAAGPFSAQPWNLDLTLIKPEISPFVFSAAKVAEGGLAIRGYAPDADGRAALETAMADLALGRQSVSEVALGDGAPGPDWTGLAIRRLGALGALDEGRLEISDYAATLSGSVATLSALSDAEALFAPPEGASEAAKSALAELDVTLSPYAFSVEKNAGAGAVARGAAPDLATAADLRRSLEARFGPGADIRINIASGAPEGWASRAQEGFDALDLLDGGELSLSDGETRLSGSSQSERNLDAAREMAGAAGAPWTLDIAYDRPTLSPFPLDVRKTSDGEVVVAGGAATAEDRGRFRDAAAAIAAGGGANIDGVILADGAPDGGWPDRVVGAIGLLGELDNGALEVRGDEFRLTGAAATPEAADELAARLDELMGPEGAALAQLTAVDPRRLASFDLDLNIADRVRLEGRLPEGLTAEEVSELLRLGAARIETDFADDVGRGDPEIWERSLSLIGEFLPEFDAARISFSGDALEVSGQVSAESSIGQVDQFLRDGLPDGTEFALQPAPEDAPGGPVEGDNRINALSGREEVYRGGFWLPVVDVAGPADCSRAAEVVLLDNRIRFLVGSADLDVRARRIINELSVISTACLQPGSPLLLEVGGHTDNTGAAEFNMGLSRDRAAAVLTALFARGVPEAGVQAVGYGETQPLADNDTEAGRAANRRISFEWLPAPEPEPEPAALEVAPGSEGETAPAPGEPTEAPGEGPIAPLQEAVGGAIEDAVEGGEGAVEQVEDAVEALPGAEALETLETPLAPPSEN